MPPSTRRDCPAWLAGALTAALLFNLPGLARADAEAPEPGGKAAESPAEKPPVAPPVSVVPDAVRTPRALLEAFFARMREDKKQAAAELLDLSQLAAIAAESRGPDLAYKLYRLIPAVGEPPRDPAAEDRGELDFSAAPTDADRPEPWPLSEWLDFPTTLAEKLVIARGPDGAWRFSAATVAAIDTLYEQVEKRIDQLSARQAAAPDGAEEPVEEPSETLSVSIRRLFPPSWRKTHFGLPAYQWALLLLWLPGGRVIDLCLRRLLTWVGDRVLRRIDPDFEEAHETTARVWRPVGRLAMVTAWVAVAFDTDLPVDVTNVLLTVLTIAAAVAAVLAAWRVIDLVAGYLSRRARRGQRKFNDLVVPLAASTAKISAALLGVIAMIAAFNDELPATLIGGLGIGGIAIALASQETLSNFIGSITLLFDRPFEVGDFVKVEGVEGEIEALGFRSTRIRTGLNSQVSLPNSKLAATVVDNWGRRRYRRYKATLGLEYGTPPERIDAFCEGIRELVRRHPHTRKDFYAAYFHDFGPASLDVLVVVFFEAPDWATELRERHRLLADILRLAGAVGVSFAFPTQTLHVRRAEDPRQPPSLGDTPADAAGARAAAEIAGELPNYQDRPGRVKFPGPTPISRPSDFG